MNFRMKFKMILAADSKGGIGKGGTLPWEGVYIRDLRIYDVSTILAPIER